MLSDLRFVPGSPRPGDPLRLLRRSAAHVNRVSGGVLVLAGAYIVWFWATNLRDPLAASGPASTIEAWSSRLTELIGDRPLWWGAALAAVVLATAVHVWRGRTEAPGRGSDRDR